MVRDDSLKATPRRDGGEPHDSQPSPELVQGWAEASRALGVRDQPSVLHDVVARYGDDRRAHHDVGHLTDVVTGVLDLSRQEPVDRVSRGIALFAAFYHDAVYEPGTPDNEYRSAELAHDRLLAAGLTRPHIDRVVRAINATAAHLGETIDQQVLVDADLAILGAHPTRYARYTAGVRREHDFVSDEDFSRGRRLVIEHLLARPAIYQTPTQRRRLEAAARANLAAELATMAQPTG